MAVFYGVPAGKTLAVAGPADVTIKGGETPVIVDSLEEFTAAAPAVSSIEPTTAETGAADLTLTVTGDKFDQNSVIIFGEFDERTTLTPEGTLTTIVKPGLFAASTVPVHVRNGPSHSNSVDFTFTEPAAKKH
jgi:IPT/TIG domain-containing protein